MGGSESVDALALHHRVGMIRGAEAELDHHCSFQLPDPRAHAGMPDLLTPTPQPAFTVTQYLHHVSALMANMNKIYITLTNLVTCRTIVNHYMDQFYII